MGCTSTTGKHESPGRSVVRFFQGRLQQISEGVSFIAETAYFPSFVPAEWETHIDELCDGWSIYVGMKWVLSRHLRCSVPPLWIATTR